MSIAALATQGSLPDIEVRRAVERVLPALPACYHRAATTAKRSPVAAVKIALSIDSSRRPSEIRAVSHAWPELERCVAGALDALRVQTAPDVGEVAVQLSLAFEPIAP